MTISSLVGLNAEQPTFVCSRFGSKHEIEGSLSGNRPQLPLAIRQAVTLVTGHPRQ